MSALFIASAVLTVGALLLPHAFRLLGAGR